MSTKSTTTKKSGTPTPHRAQIAAGTERMRKTALGESTQRRAGGDDRTPLPLHEATVVRGDGRKVRVTVPRPPRDEPPRPESAEGGPEVAPSPAVAPDANVGNDGGALVKAGNPKRGAKSAAKPSKDAKAAAPAEKTPKGTRGAIGEAAKRAKQSKAQKPAKSKRLSCLDAAAIVIADANGTPMRATELIAEITKRGLWSSPIGKTPEATLYAAIIREIAAKGTEARFKKHDRGLFVAAPHGKGA